MIRACSAQDFDQILSTINDGAQAYRGIIPADFLTDPYMSGEELRYEIASGVEFWGYEQDGILLGVMGLQSVKDVSLIRHAYVRTLARRSGIGARLLSHMKASTVRPILVGTWANADWAVRFYEKHGFEVVSHAEKERLLRTYWTVSERQIETSLVLKSQTRKS